MASAGELSLTETVCIKDVRKVARDNTGEYHWRVLQLLPGTERPDGELMIRHHREAADFQEGPLPSSALLRVASTCCPDAQPQENSHLNEA